MNKTTDFFKNTQILSFFLLVADLIDKVHVSVIVTAFNGQPCPLLLILRTALRGGDYFLTGQ